MKRNLLGIIGLSIIGLALTSCNFVDILAKKIKKLKIVDSSTAYVVGDSYDFSKLKITATYTDNKEATLNKNDVAFDFKLGTQTYDINSAFAEAGEYTLTVNKDEITSNSVTVYVYASTQYVTNITVNGKHEVEEKKSISLDLEVSPTRYTVPIEYQISNSSIISVTKINDASYSVKGLAVGSSTITFKALSSENTYFERAFTVTVNISSKVEIEQLYGDYVKHYAYNTSSCPSVGENVKLLVIPVWFSDSSNYVSASKKDNMKEDITKTFFGTSVETGWHSVSSYYAEESRGALHLTGTVSEWYSPSIAATTVSGYNTNQQAAFVKNAVTWYFTNHSSGARTNYDYDGDGYLDGVMLIYAAPDYQLYSSFTSNMWAYCFFVQDTSLKNVTNPGVNAFFWASYDFIYGSNAYSRTGGNYHNGDTSHCNIDAHTFIHEMGHMFGLEDYYDYSSSTYAKSPAAGFSMQDNNVGGHDPFSTMALGWSNPYIPASSTELTINDFQSSGDVILLSPQFNSYNSPFDEYLLLELYTPTGLNEFDSTYKYDTKYPMGPSIPGIRLWHVDARLFTTSGNFITNAKTSTPGVYFATGFNNTYCYDGEDTLHPEQGRSSFAYEYGHSLDYQRINMLQLIRKDTNADYYAKNDLAAGDLFVKNNSFNMTTYSQQFYYNNGKLNNGNTLGWSFTVNNIDSNPDGTYFASIQLVKA